MWKHVCIQVGVCDGMCDGVCRHWCICRYECVCVCVCVCVCERERERMCIYAKARSDIFTVSRPQGSLGNTSSSSCPLSPNKQTESFLQVFMEPLTHAPPQGIWKSSDLASLEGALGEEGTRGQRDALHTMSVLKNTLSLLWCFRQPREVGPDSDVASLLWGNQGSGDTADPESPGQEAEAQGLGTQHCQSRGPQPSHHYS